jgi:hypothetical protein
LKKARRQTVEELVRGEGFEEQGRLATGGAPPLCYLSVRSPALTLTSTRPMLPERRDLAETRYAAEQRSELGVGDTQEPCRPLRDAVTITGRPVNIDVPEKCPGWRSVHLARFNDVQIDIRLTGPKNDVAVGVDA